MGIYEEFKEKLEGVTRDWERVYWKYEEIQALGWLAKALETLAREAKAKASEIFAEIGPQASGT